MEFSIKAGTPEKLRSGCLVLGAFDGRKLTAAGEAADAAAEGALGHILSRGDLDEKAGATLLLHNVPGTVAERVLLVSLGKEKEFSDKDYRSAVAGAAKALGSLSAADAVFCLTEAQPASRDATWCARQAAQILRDSTYRFEACKSKNSERKRGVRKVTFLAPAKAEVARLQTGVSQGDAIAQGMALTRELGNLPANICTPTYLAQQARSLGKQHKLKVDVLERADMEKLGMGALLSVARGSHQPPKFIVFKYDGAKGAKKAKPIVLVGKGITFDTGGISLKPGEAMDEMKFDMCGAASVFGTLKACALMGLPLNVVGLVPTTENMPGGAATKPGDVVTSMSGQTIEILNTDAEGRLILCDALSYAERFNPECVIDIATLTGACIIALGHVASGLLANDDVLARELLAVGQESGDRAWQLPLWEDYQEQLKSNFADMANIGGRPAGTVTAACFLARYTKQYRWAHLDIAGTAWKSGAEKGATGRPVPLLTHFLLGRCA